MVVRRKRRSRKGVAPYSKGRSTGAFTLMELLIVIAIITVLASLLLPAIWGAHRKAMQALCVTQINAIRGALASYEAEKSVLPRRPGTPTAMTVFQNDVAWLYAALRNRPTTPGGGTGRAIDWPVNQIGHAPGAVGGLAYDTPFFGAQNPWTTAAIFGTPLGPDEQNRIDDPSFQAEYAPGTPSALVFLDPWGNPLVYREWRSVPNVLKDSFITSPLVPSSVLLSGGASESHPLFPHDPESYDLYSPGPNGVNEYGEGDDLTNWGSR